MGFSEAENPQGLYDPQHPVILTEGFWLAETACTQALWVAVMNDNPGLYNENLQNPVETVSWFDVYEIFLPKINELIPGLMLTLPTEAQWEYACRAGTTTPSFFGEQISTDQANFDGNRPYKNDPGGIWRRQTVPVKALPANSWGLYQMHGNVWEWCFDQYARYGKGVVEDPVVLQGIGRRNQIIRGGCWCDRGEATLSAFRSCYEPQDRNDTIGFRLARAAR